MENSDVIPGCKENKTFGEIRIVFSPNTEKLERRRLERHVAQCQPCSLALEEHLREVQRKVAQTRAPKPLKDWLAEQAKKKRPPKPPDS